MTMNDQKMFTTVNVARTFRVQIILICQMAVGQLADPDS